MGQRNSSQLPVKTSLGEAQVSVVVPSYDHALFIESTLRSIFRQQFAPAQLLVIDDGSTDDSPRVIDRVLQDCPFPCELLVRAHRGLCATLNEGLAKTHARYFAYLGSDDFWLPDFLAARVPMLESRSAAALAYGHAFLVNEDDQIIDCTLDWAHYTDGDARAMLWQENIAPMSPTVLHRRAALERYGWNENARLEDYELYLRLSAEGEFAFDPEVLAAWRRHGSNTSRDFVWMIEARLEAQRAVADELGVSAEELDHFQRLLKFAGAEDLLRLGEKRQSLTFLRQGWRAASPVARAGIILRLLAPHSLTRLRRRLKQTRAVKQYPPLPL